MDNEEMNEGVTIGDVFRVLKRKIWWILGAAVLFTASMILLLEFLVNPLLATYSMEFRLIFPSEGNSTYPDGSPFFYQDIISRDSLAAAKNSDNAFSSIDIEKMNKNGHIAIEAETETVNDVKVYTGRYTITVQGAYFRGEDQAADFIRAVAGLPVTDIKNRAKEVNYALDEKAFESAPFEERLLLLAQEKESLLSVYENWIEVFSETYTVQFTDAEGNRVARRLKDFHDSVAALFGESVKLELENELEFGGYYWTGNGADLNDYLTQLENEYIRNRDEIDQLAVAQTNGSARIVELISRNNNIAYWVGFDYDEETDTVTRNGNGTLTAENVEKYAARLKEEFDQLNKEADELINVVSAIYARGMTVRFDKQTVTSSGDVNTIVGAIGSLIGGLIIAGAIAYAVETNRKKKEKTRESDRAEEETAGEDKQ